MLPLAVDENVQGVIVRGLRRRQPNIDLVRVQDVGFGHTPDPRILEWAAAEGRIVITEDVSTMVGFAWERVKAGISVPGVIVRSGKVTVNQVIDDLLLVATCGVAQDFKDQVKYPL